MGFYAERIFPRVMNTLMNAPEVRKIRARVCEGLSGEVVEIGFGTGHNLPFLPPSVTKLYAVDPMRRGRELARERLDATHVPVEFVGLDGQSIPLPDESVDAALSTWTLCSIPDPVAAVREVRRVLRPDGKLHFAEHGHAPDEGVQRWQRRLNGFQQKVACGCNLTRDIPALLEEGGLVVDRVDAYYAKGEPKTHGWTFEGVARPG